MMHPDSDAAANPEAVDAAPPPPPSPRTRAEIDHDDSMRGVIRHIVASRHDAAPLLSPQSAIGRKPPRHISLDEELFVGWRRGSVE